MPIIERLGYKFHMDGFLLDNLTHMVREVTKKNYDGFVLITGREGFGKSTFAIQLASFVDPTFCLDRVVFTADQFLEAVREAPRYSAVVFYETMGYLSSRGAMSKFNKTLIKVMSEMRSKNLFVFLCIPNFFMMDWYVAYHRTTGLIYIPRRGVFYSYDYPTKKKLYIQGKRDHNYAVVRHNYFGRFIKTFLIDKEAYEKKKQDAINDFDGLTQEQKRTHEQKKKLINHLKKEKGMTCEEIGKIIDLSVEGVRFFTR
jgi:hypothetical protein